MRLLGAADGWRWRVRFDCGCIVRHDGGFLECCAVHVVSHGDPLDIAREQYAKSQISALRSRVAELEAVERAAREYRDALHATCGSCHGTRQRHTSCTRCGDSTDDHFCNDDIVPCRDKIHAVADALDAALAAVEVQRG